MDRQTDRQTVCSHQQGAQASIPSNSPGISFKDPAASKHAGKAGTTPKSSASSSPGRSHRLLVLEPLGNSRLLVLVENIRGT